MLYPLGQIHIAIVAKKMEQAMGIGPTQPAWEAGVLPLNYACKY